MDAAASVSLGTYSLQAEDNHESSDVMLQYRSIQDARLKLSAKREQCLQISKELLQQLSGGRFALIDTKFGGICIGELAHWWYDFKEPSVLSEQLKSYKTDIQTKVLKDALEVSTIFNQCYKEFGFEEAKLFNMLNYSIFVGDASFDRTVAEIACSKFQISFDSKDKFPAIKILSPSLVPKLTSSTYLKRHIDKNSPCRLHVFPDATTVFLVIDHLQAMSKEKPLQLLYISSSGVTSVSSFLLEIMNSLRRTVNVDDLTLQVVLHWLNIAAESSVVVLVFDGFKNVLQNDGRVLNAMLNIALFVSNCYSILCAIDLSNTIMLQTNYGHSSYFQYRHYLNSLPEVNFEKLKISKWSQLPLNILERLLLRSTSNWLTDDDLVKANIFGTKSNKNDTKKSILKAWFAKSSDSVCRLLTVLLRLFDGKASAVDLSHVLEFKDTKTYMILKYLSAIGIVFCPMSHDSRGVEMQWNQRVFVIITSQAALLKIIIKGTSTHLSNLFHELGERARMPGFLLPSCAIKGLHNICFLIQDNEVEKTVGNVTVIHMLALHRLYCNVIAKEDQVKLFLHWKQYFQEQGNQLQVIHFLLLASICSNVLADKWEFLVMAKTMLDKLKIDVNFRLEFITKHLMLLCNIDFRQYSYDEQLDKDEINTAKELSLKDIELTNENKDRHLLEYLYSLHSAIAIVSKLSREKLLQDPLTEFIQLKQYTDEVLSTVKSVSVQKIDRGLFWSNVSHLHVSVLQDAVAQFNFNVRADKASSLDYIRKSIQLITDYHLNYSTFHFRCMKRSSNVFRELGSYDEAITSIKTAINLCKTLALGHHELAQLHLTHAGLSFSKSEFETCIVSYLASYHYCSLAEMDGNSSNHELQQIIEHDFQSALQILTVKGYLNMERYKELKSYMRFDESSKLTTRPFSASNQSEQIAVQEVSSDDATLVCDASSSSPSLDWKTNLEAGQERIDPAYASNQKVVIESDDAGSKSTLESLEMARFLEEQKRFLEEQERLLEEQGKKLSNITLNYAGEQMSVNREFRRRRRFPFSLTKFKSKFFQNTKPQLASNQSEQMAVQEISSDDATLICDASSSNTSLDLNVEAGKERNDPDMSKPTSDKKDTIESDGADSKRYFATPEMIGFILKQQDELLDRIALDYTGGHMYDERFRRSDIEEEIFYREIAEKLASISDGIPEKMKPSLGFSLDRVEFNLPSSLRTNFMSFLTKVKYLIDLPQSSEFQERIHKYLYTVMTSILDAPDYRVAERQNVEPSPGEVKKDKLTIRMGTNFGMYVEKDRQSPVTFKEAPYQEWQFPRALAANQSILSDVIHVDFLSTVSTEDQPVIIAFQHKQMKDEYDIILKLFNKKKMFISNIHPECISLPFDLPGLKQNSTVSTFQISCSGIYLLIRERKPIKRSVGYSENSEEILISQDGYQMSITFPEHSVEPFELAAQISHPCDVATKMAAHHGVSVSPLIELSGYDGRFYKSITICIPCEVIRSNCLLVMTKKKRNAQWKIMADECQVKVDETVGTLSFSVDHFSFYCVVYDTFSYGFQYLPLIASRVAQYLSRDYYQPHWALFDKHLDRNKWRYRVICATDWSKELKEELKEDEEFNYVTSSSSSVLLLPGDALKVSLSDDLASLTGNEKSLRFWPKHRYMEQQFVVQRVDHSCDSSKVSSQLPEIRGHAEVVELVKTYQQKMGDCGNTFLLMDVSKLNLTSYSQDDIFLTEEHELIYRNWILEDGSNADNQTVLGYISWYLIECDSNKKRIDYVLKLCDAIDKSRTERNLSKVVNFVMKPIDNKESWSQNLFDVVAQRTLKRWCDLAECLGFNKYDVERIDHDSARGYLDEKTMILLNNWVERGGNKCTVLELIKAIKCIDDVERKYDICEQIRKYYTENWSASTA